MQQQQQQSNDEIGSSAELIKATPPPLPSQPPRIKSVRPSTKSAASTPVATENEQSPKQTGKCQNLLLVL